MLRRLAMLTLLAAGIVAVTTKTTSKAQATEKRVNNLVGQVSDLNTSLNALSATALTTAGGTITGDLHIDGTLYGTGGTLTCGDNLFVAGVMTANGTITTHAGFRGSSTTGVGGQGAAGTVYDQTYEQAQTNRINDLIAALG